ncbi:hypothetical protein FisN_6Lh215 [Fistulifera solaris]|uniref:DUF6824 domain-containing protein n=1 Tax=Fistulifera solaris TaxID=1519565 RepID=A0A1Z5J6K9_FISSO|nr:hypothetical protein FisN_6Lh215 [Fistulifera solaris]|eukprot:GAX09411.1 hypothetical protein FisN_6Lh215 [Fistulifera solaris]
MNRIQDSCDENSPCKNIICMIGKGIASIQNRDRAVIYDTPVDSDVLCGQDKNLKNHPGNKIFDSMVKSEATRYQGASSKQEKMDISQEIVTNMRKRYNSRFLKKFTVNGKEFWKEISDAKARDKVTHKIRGFAKEFKRCDRSPSPDNTSMTSKESETEMKSGPQDTVLGALIQKRQMIMSNTEISALGTQDQQQFSHACLSRYEDHLDSVRSDDIREFLIEPFGVRYDSKETVFNSLRTEDLDAMDTTMAEPVPVNEWRDPMIE